jgi:hypothetical protein
LVFGQPLEFLLIEFQCQLVEPCLQLLLVLLSQTLELLQLEFSDFKLGCGCVKFIGDPLAFLLC